MGLFSFGKESPQNKAEAGMTYAEFLKSAESNKRLGTLVSLYQEGKTTPEQFVATLEHEGMAVPANLDALLDQLPKAKNKIEQAYDQAHGLPTEGPAVGTALFKEQGTVTRTESATLVSEHPEDEEMIARLAQPDALSLTPEMQVVKEADGENRSDDTQKPMAA